MNAFTLMVTGFGTTHVSGTATKIGVAVAHDDHTLMGYAFGVWFCFYIGGAFSGFVIVSEQFALGRSYGHALLIVSAFLLWASIWAIHFPSNHHYVFITAIASGIQNGVTTR